MCQSPSLYDLSLMLAARRRAAAGTSARKFHVSCDCNVRFRQRDQTQTHTATHTLW
jgi:hypothetical protein